MQSMPYYQQGYQQAPSPYGANPPVASLANGAPSMMTHPAGLPPLQHPGLEAGAPTQPQTKRKQVKNACTNCQKACKKCDDARPCPRCVKYGIADTCVNSVRKERKKGIKRGPYKRRQKQDGDKGSRKDGMPEQQQYAPAMRAASMPFGYPSNLNQYGQPYDPYGQYAAYHKDQMMPQPYVVNPVYPPTMAYPVLVPGQGADGSQPPQQQQAQHPSYQHSPMPQHYGGGMMHHSPQTSRPMMQHGDVHQPTAQYYQQPHSQPHSQRSSPHLQEVKADQDGFIKPQPMTPIPSTSTSTNTTSSPDSGNCSKKIMASFG
ncbi:uncharacterized protein BYT42DRAFT_496443 [Radiomyces spectabilis]|uniref:uncharacterized protein n=1 Tax=Radiomyces spectabilis TaxID=64574 RepID=UPI002220C2F7|nr:uncharacterized protein BYT42DRAFT_496443 [Radiomyces spectabilis]KAI8379256.1 hypothetical protein BYT42DRAFT_496443 [Radiomyces spectabilis]